jgi:hypothetical protein
MSHWILEKRLSRPSSSDFWAFILFPPAKPNPKPSPFGWENPLTPDSLAKNIEKLFL